MKGGGGGGLRRVHSEGRQGRRHAPLFSRSMQRRMEAYFSLVLSGSSTETWGLETLRCLVPAASSMFEGRDFGWEGGGEGRVRADATAMRMRVEAEGSIGIASGDLELDLRLRWARAGGVGAAQGW
jgi:hypothetical protein